MSSQSRVARAAVAAALAASIALALPSALAGQSVGCVEIDRGSGCPDLTIAVPATQFSDDGLTLHLDVAVTNVGGGNAPETDVVADAPEWERATGRVRMLRPDETARLTLDLPVPDARRGRMETFTVTVDPAGHVGEPETNRPNSIEVGVEIPLPELGVTRGSERFLDDAARLEIVVVVANGSGAGPTPETRVEGVAPGWEPASAAVAELAPGGGQRATLLFAVPRERLGRQERFVVTVDPDGEVAEQDDGNNAVEFVVDVPAPNLGVADVDGRELDGGTRLALTVGVANTGGAVSPGAVVEAAAPGWEPVRETIGELASRGSATVSLEFDVAVEQRGRTHTFVVTVSPSEGVPDADPADDSVSVAVSLAAAPEPHTAGDDEEEEEGSGLPLWVVLLAAALILVGLVVLRLVRPRAAPREEPTAAAPLPEPAPPERVVSTGFADEATPAEPLDSDTTLACAASYYFWLEVGEPVPGSIEAEPATLPLEDLPAGARLTVALFGLDGDVSLSTGDDVGELRLLPDGDVVVERQAARELPLPQDSPLAARRLFFLVRTPETAREVQLRCNVYHEQVLVQSRLVRAEVTAVREQRPGALTARVDYTLAPRLHPPLLASLPPHRLSVLLNRNGDGTHGFSFFGEHAFKSDASFDELELQDLIRQARAALRRAAWGDEEGWSEGKPYLYEQPAVGQLETDLIRFALRGFRFYTAIIDRLAGGPDAAQALESLMAKPGLVQIASKESPRHLLPASLIYDRMGFDAAARFTDYTVCESFLDALDRGEPLERLRCFEGDCPSKGAELVVCPSGFWGYRHRLGLPVSVAGAPDAPAALVSAAPSLVVAVSTDPEFALREAHELELRALLEGRAWNYAATRSDAIRLMKETKAEVVYFYCHGGLQESVPYLLVGPLGERPITADYLFSQRVRWDAPRPLVFINGCRTTALEPEHALEFVSFLVRRAQAAGVIGTEITVFEPLARAFAEECLRRFLAGAPIGDAVRAARLALLQERNPLGLAYVPFVLAGLRIVRE